MILIEEDEEKIGMEEESDVEPKRKNHKINNLV
jgi:hypothetical protein